MDYKKANKTVGTASNLVSFGKAIEALKQGKRVQRLGWNGKGLFIFEQVPSQVPAEIIPKTTSLPQTVKDEFKRRNEDFQKRSKDVDPIMFNSITYQNQLALVKPNNEINGWSPSTSDSLANDWIILD